MQLLTGEKGFYTFHIDIIQYNILRGLISTSCERLKSDTRSVIKSNTFHF